MHRRLISTEEALVAGGEQLPTHVLKHLPILLERRLDRTMQGVLVMSVPS